MIGLSFLLISLLGISIGVISGILPGLHSNTVAVFLISLSPLLLSYIDPIQFGVLLMSIAVTHAIIDFIPSIFLGAPSPEATVLSVLPGHRLLLEGRGHEAIRLTVFGCVLGVVFSIVTLPMVIKGLPIIFKLVRPHTHFLLLAVVLHMILTEKGLKKLWTAFVFLLSGLFGYVVLNSHAIRNPLFPSLTGLFGFSTLILSLKEEPYLPEQRYTKISLSKRKILVASGIGFLTTLMLAFLPGVGPAQAVVLASELFRVVGIEEFLVTLGSVNLVDVPISLAALYSFGRPRSGTVAMMQKVITKYDLNVFLLMSFNVLFVSGIAALIAVGLSKKMSELLAKIDYHNLSILVILIISLLIFWLTGSIGLLTAFTGTLIGITCALLGVKRSACMGFLLCPTIIYFAGLSIT